MRTFEFEGNFFLKDLWILLMFIIFHLKDILCTLEPDQAQNMILIHSTDEGGPIKTLHFSF